MANRPFGVVLVVAGVVLAAVGVLVWLGAFRWFGRLPGDFKMERPGMSVSVPFVSMLLVSVGLSLLAALVRALLSRRG